MQTDPLFFIMHEIKSAYVFLMVRPAGFEPALQAHLVALEGLSLRPGWTTAAHSVVNSQIK
jgi:hypothetical protein